MRNGFFVPAVLLLAGLLPGCSSGIGGGAGAGPPAPSVDTGAFIGTIGNDTVTVEEFRRSADRLEGRQLVRTPSLRIREYEADLGPDGSIRRFEVSYRNSLAEEPDTRIEMDFADGSATTRVTQGDSTRTIQGTIAENPLPFLSFSVALYELPLVALRAGDADSIGLSLLPPGSSQAAAGAAVAVGEDSVMLRNIAGVNRLRVGSDGRVLAWDGGASTLKLFAEREAYVNFDEIAADFGSRTAQGGGLGMLSPRDTANATVGGAELMVDYSRPSRRGRTVFPNVVPWGEVWRTGANAATQLRTSRDLVIGGTAVPAGSYTLWTIPGPDGWQLIINKQTGQWGTVYDAAQDLARVPMTSSGAATPIEQFTISISPAAGDTAELAMAWGSVRATVPITVR